MSQIHIFCFILKENGDVRGRSDQKKKEISILNSSTGGLEGDDTEQLDFEAEEKVIGWSTNWILETTYEYYN